MTSADQSPSGGDRNAAISAVDAAFKAGRIVQADRDMRVDQIKNASTQQDVHMVVRDLLPAAPPAPVAPVAAPMVGAGTPPAGQQPWPLVNYGPTAGQPATAQIATLSANAGKKIGGIIFLVVLLSVVVPIAGVIIGLVSAKDTFDDINFGEPTDEATYLPGQEPGENGVNVHTVDGYNDLVIALDDETGSTEVFSAVLYPRYAVLSVPETATGKRYRSWYWDGRDLVANDFKNTADEPRIDLESVDPDVLVTLLKDVRSRIEKPTSWYVSIDSRPIATEGSQLAVYASNEYSEGAYVIADLDGTITYESTYGS